MKFKLFYGISIFNVLLLVLTGLYIALDNFYSKPNISVTYLGYIILTSFTISTALWSILAYRTSCPHCSQQALRVTLSNKSNVQTSTIRLPFLLQPFSFMIDKEFFEGYCHCNNCRKKIYFNIDNSTETIKD